MQKTKYILLLCSIQICSLIKSQTFETRLINEESSSISEISSGNFIVTNGNSFYKLSSIGSVIFGKEGIGYLGCIRNNAVNDNYVVSNGGSAIYVDESAGFSFFQMNYPGIAFSAKAKPEALNDNSYLIGGHGDITGTLDITEHPLLAKITNSGNVVWLRRVGYSWLGFGSINSVTDILKSNYLNSSVICGRQMQLNNFGWIQRLDNTTGATISSKTFSLSNGLQFLDNVPISICELSTGELIVAGAVTIDGTQSWSCLLRFDIALNLIESKILENSSPLNQEFYVKNIVEKNNRIYCYGSYRNENYSSLSIGTGCLIMLDYAFNILDIVNYTRNNSMSLSTSESFMPLTDLIVTSDNHLAMVGQDELENSPGIITRAGHIIKVDLNGEGANVCYYHLNGFVLNPLSCVIADDGQNIIKSLSQNSYSDPLIDINNSEAGCCSFDPGMIETYCLNPGNTINICAPLGYVTYVWNGNQYSQCYTITSIGTYEVEMVDANGCVGREIITVTAPNFTGASIAGDDNKCASSPTYTLIGAPVGSTYVWSAPWGIITSGAGTNTIAVTWPSPSTPSSLITCTVTDPGGCYQTFTFYVKQCCEPLDNLYQTSPDGPTNLSTYSWATTLPPNAKVYIYNDLFIDINVNWTNETLYVAPGYKITINPGITLDATRCIFQNMCDEMWQGIVLPSSNSTFIATRCKFIQAIEGVFSDKRAPFTVSGTGIPANLTTNGTTYTSEFINCLIGIKVNPFTGTHPGLVQGTKFHTSGSGLLYPHLGITGLKGIEINGSPTSAGVINIGNGSSLNDGNTFYNLRYGITDDFSDINVFNCHFKNIIGDPFDRAACRFGTGICISGTKSVGTDAIIGNATNFNENKFINCWYGIKTNDFVKLVASENTFNTMQQVGIHCDNNQGTTVDINNNTFFNFNIGIRCEDNPGANLNIYDNTMTATFSGTGITVGNTAIHLTDVLNTRYNANISNNTLRLCKTGIWIRNAEKLSNFDIHNLNTIQLQSSTPSATNRMYGVRLEGCSKINVESNDIWRGTFTLSATPLPTLATSQFLQGITTAGSGACTISKNNIYKMGYGLHIQGPCQNTIYACNLMHRNWNPVFFTGASITDQYLGNVSQANRYVLTQSVAPVADLNGGLVVSSPLPQWYYNVSGIYSTGNFDPNPNNVPTSELTLTGTGDGSTDICSSVLLLSPSDERELKAGNIARDIRTFSINPEENRFFDRIHAFRYLKQNPSLISLGLTSDSDFQNFYSTEVTSNIGKETEVEEEILNENYSTAKIINNSISPLITLEQKVKDIHNIYIRILEGDTLDYSDSLMLNEIAFSDPLLSGSSVYSARVILNIDPADGFIDRAAAVFDSNLKDIVSSEVFRIYPNPTNKNFIIEQVSDVESNYFYRLNDIMGKQLFESDIKSKQMIVNMEDLPNGVYILFINDLKVGNLIRQEKIILNK